MAGGKLTPRQKMINLMYLVFIAMLAMNMSKEVLSAFGLINERFEAANASATATNEQMLQALDTKASESKGEFIAAAATAHKVEAATKKFYDFVATLKAEVLKGVEVDKETGKLPYEAMDKADNLDHSWFTGDGYTSRGKEVMSAIESYKAEMNAALADKKYAPILNEINNKFDLTEVKDKEGVKIKYLDYHFKGFPAIASLAKLTAWQNDAKKAESDVISSALGKAAVSEASYSKFQAIVALDKNVFFQGEPVTGKVVLGKYDPNAKFSGFQGPGRLENGQAVISTTAGAVGEQTLSGSFNFIENGKPIKLPFQGKYVVVPRPNSANISADKMNVVYRGLPNPMTISFAGIGDNFVNASAPGLSKAGGNGKYVLTPQSGTEVTVSVSGKMTDGKTVTDKKVFRIKNIPAPAGAIGGVVGVQKGAKSRLEVSTISADLQDFVYDLKYEVTRFSFKVPGQPAIIVSGNKVDQKCRAALARATKGDQISIFDIKTKIVGASGIIPKDASPVIYEIQ
ncbi:MAG: gliding motility protein GldM [Flavobacterium sp.]|uniref:type IX secretion system motor protein PorM/GldM n=1 Tax=Flavobacterium sp. TaxID=239 RepID=UPI0025C3ABCB|nr:gliding motility protein GldM [Flavobacterium sp.]MBA4134245.1 gliding motility protein GldM [Flavobacterium sp.]